MKKNELKIKLENGFNVAKVAELCDCSIGRINELKRENDYEAIAAKFNLDANELKNFCENHINVNAIFGFCEKHEINVEEWSDADIEAACQHKERVKNELNIEIGTVLPNGKKVIKIQKVGNSLIYITDDYICYNQKELKELYKPEA